jgi:hypothetical protein
MLGWQSGLPGALVHVSGSAVPPSDGCGRDIQLLATQTGAHHISMNMSAQAGIKHGVVSQGAH